MAHTSVTKAHSANTGVANTYSYSGSFDVFKGSEVVVTLDAVTLTFTASTINESASPREYTVDTTAKTVHIGGADLSSGSIVLRPNTDPGAPTARATFTAGSAITASDLNENQTQLLRLAIEYDDNSLSNTGGTMTGDLEMGQNADIIFEGATDNAYETTLTVADPSADRTITLPNVTGTVVTTGDTGSVATGMVADDAITADKLANSINSEIAANTAKTTNATHTGDVTGATSLTIATGAVNSAKIANGAIVNDDINASAGIAHSKLANVTDGRILVGNGSNVPTAVAVSGDVTLANDGAVTIANDAVEIGMIGCEQTTISDSDSHIPTSGAVVDYVAAQLEPFGGFEVIANRTSFPNTPPAAGVVISILDASGVVFDSSSTPDTTAGNCTEADGTAVTIQAAPDALQGKTIGAGIGLLCAYSGSGTNYTFHRLLAKDSDVERLSQDIDDFNNRYRVNAGEPGSNNDQGDLVFDTSASKMKVYDGSSWGEVTSTGEFKYLVMCNPGTTDAATLNGSNFAFDLKETSTSGSAASVTSAAQLIVSVNGVIQKPNPGTNRSGLDGFVMADADTINFCAGVPSSADVFIIQVGSAVSIPTPGDDTVTSAKIVNGAILNVDVNASAAIVGSKLADDSIAEVKLDIHNAPSGTDKFLAYTSNGMEWAVPTDTNTQLTAEAVEDIVGGMLDGTETGISVSYDDTDGNIDFVVSTPTDITVADESSDTTCFPLFVTAATGDLEPKSGSNLTFNSNTGALGATSFTGDGSALTGITAVPAGAVIAWTTASAPTGWLICDGSAVSRSTYSGLFGVISDDYGAGDGSSTFNLPDYRGEFLRGTDGGRSVDPDRSSRTDRGDGTGGDVVGSKQGHMYASHSHSNGDSGGSGAASPGSYGRAFGNWFTGASGGNETRPRNVNVNWIIKT